MQSLRVVWVIIAGVCLLALSGCATASQVAPTPTPWPTPVIVQQATYAVQQGTVSDFINLDGRLSPVFWEPVFFKVDGKLTVLNATESAFVKKGDILAELDSKVLNDQRSTALLTLEQAQSSAQQSDASRKYSLERARLNLQTQELLLTKLKRAIELGPTLQAAQAETELEKARLNLQRAQTAYNAVAHRPDIAMLPQAATLQSATLDYQLAETKHRLATQGDADIQLAQQEIQVKLARLSVQELEEKAAQGAGSDVEKAQIQVQALERQIEERKLRAPFDGQVAAIGVNVQGLTRGFAQRPKVGDNIPAYAALVVLAKPEPLEITIDSNQKRVPELFIGQTVTVSHAAWSHPFTASITALPVAMTSTGNQPTGSQAVRIALPKNAPPMANGDPVRIAIEAETNLNTVWVHPNGVRRFAGRAFVVLQESDRQRRVDVTLGLENEQQVEILSGLKVGEVVVGP